MISKPLFKQSVKANFTRWLVVTVASCFIVAIVIMILGNLNVNEIRESMTTLFEDADKEADIKTSALDSYESLKTLNQTITTSYDTTKQIAELSLSSYVKAVAQLPAEQAQETVATTVYNTILAQTNDEEQANSAKEVALMTIQVSTSNSQATPNDITKEIIEEKIYKNVQEEKDEEEARSSKEAAEYFINMYIEKGALSEEDTTRLIAEYIGQKVYNEAIKDYSENTARTVQNSAQQAVLSYVNLTSKGQNEEEAKKELTKSLIEQLPQKVEDAIIEIKDLDVYGLVLGNILYKIALLLLPMIFVIMTANDLIAGQVDSGSMAYVLSTPTKRSKVSATQMVYLVSAIFTMVLCIAITSLTCVNIVKSAEFTISAGEVLKFNIGVFCILFAISGICYFASAYFNRTKNSLSVGGGITMFFLVCAILGLFGEKVIPSAIRIEAMNKFNYCTIISLFNVNSILSGTTEYIKGFLILIAIGIVGFALGRAKFNKKDLPL